MQGGWHSDQVTCGVGGTLDAGWVALGKVRGTGGVSSGGVLVSGAGVGGGFGQAPSGDGAVPRRSVVGRPEETEGALEVLAVRINPTF